MPIHHIIVEPQVLRERLLEVYERIRVQVPVPADRYPAEWFLEHCDALRRESVKSVVTVMCTRMQLSHPAIDKIILQVSDPGGSEPSTYIQSLDLFCTAVLMAAVARLAERFSNRSLAAVRLMEGAHVLRPVKSYFDAWEEKLGLGRRRRQRRARRE